MLGGIWGAARCLLARPSIQAAIRGVSIWGGLSRMQIQRLITIRFNIEPCMPGRICHAGIHSIEARFVFGMDRRCQSLFLALAAAWLLSRCVSKVQIPAVEQFQVTSGDQTKNIDADAHGETLRVNLYQLIKANEGVEVPNLYSKTGFQEMY